MKSTDLDTFISYGLFPNWGDGISLRGWAIDAKAHSGKPSARADCLDVPKDARATLTPTSRIRILGHRNSCRPIHVAVFIEVVHREIGVFFSIHWTMNLIVSLRVYAVDAGIVKNNPVRDVKMPRAKTEGFKPWEAADVEKFYATHPEGSQERLAMDMLPFTGLRRSDIFQIGPQHVKDNIIEYRAGKNDEWVHIPVHPDLRAILDAVKKEHLAYLVTPVHGRPFKSAAAFGNWFGQMCAETGVDGRAHDLRKTLAQLLVESGNSNSKLKARFGWRSVSMVNHYTRKADKRKLAISSAAKLNENSLTPQTKSIEGLTPENKAKTNT